MMMKMMKINIKIKEIILKIQFFFAEVILKSLVRFLLVCLSNHKRKCIFELKTSLESFGTRECARLSADQC